MDRRDFLKTGGAAAASALVPDGFSVDAVVREYDALRDALWG